mmetsp:Transcript_27312/g.64878  ORF Transcript_27312/g.64878 Transcript_27312/m.64878 type:complete len:424 (+) Transcript_27312:176-1447(+)
MMLLMLRTAALAACIACNAVSMEIDRAFASGVADTKHVVQKSSGKTILHNYVCFQRASHPYVRSGTTRDLDQARNQCCFDLYKLGMLSIDQYTQYCLKRVARIPTVSTYSIQPAFHLAIEEDAGAAATDGIESGKYHQKRDLTVYEDKEREKLTDARYINGVFSPFHLKDFTPVRSRTRGIMKGHIKGDLEEGGGMHRSFRQTIELAMPWIRRLSDRTYATVNATVFLPISESIFIDADDAMIKDYLKGSNSNGSTLCQLRSENSASISNVICNIDFINAEVIDVEQPSFASRPYVVAFQIMASFELSGSNNDDELRFVIEYGTRIHVRYQEPAQNSSNNELVTVSIQQPVLYSATAKLDITARSTLFSLNLNDVQPAADPVVFTVATGNHSDYWFVTIATMGTAFVGGVLLIRRIDSISTWR